MKSNLLFFVGLFTALLISWAGIVLGSNAQLGGLAPYYDDNQGASFPDWMPGVGARGQLVYKDLGCAACHTQQVRRPDFGSDKARGWGERQSVARDYIYQPFPQLGLSRIGPDLANLADRKPTAMDADDLLKLLYTGVGAMPPYRFLFEMRRLGVEAQPSDRALQLTGTLKPKAGWEVVPTDRALDLVGYLLSLKTSFDYPEAVPVAAPKAEGEAPAAAPAAGAKSPAPAPKTPAPAGGASPTPAAGAATPAPSSPAGAPSPTPAPGGSAPAPASNAPAPAGGTSPTPAAGSAAPSPTPASGSAPPPAPGGSAPAAAPAGGAPSPAPASTGTAPAAAPGTPTPTGGAPAAPASNAPSPSGTPTPTGGKS